MYSAVYTYMRFSRTIMDFWGFPWKKGGFIRNQTYRSHANWNNATTVASDVLTSLEQVAPFYDCWRRKLFCSAERERGNENPSGERSLSHTRPMIHNWRWVDFQPVFFVDYTNLLRWTIYASVISDMFRMNPRISIGPCRFGSIRLCRFNSYQTIEYWITFNLTDYWNSFHLLKKLFQCDVIPSFY